MTNTKYSKVHIDDMAFTFDGRVFKPDMHLAPLISIEQTFDLDNYDGAYGKPVIAGGFLRDLMFGYPSRDIDMFMLNTLEVSEEEHEDNSLLFVPDEVAEHFYEKGFVTNEFPSERPVNAKGLEKKFSVLNIEGTGYSQDGGLPLQIISRPDETTIEDLLDDFDYSLVRIAYDFEDRTFTFDQEAFQQVMEKKAYEFPTKHSFNRSQSFRRYATQYGNIAFTHKMSNKEKMKKIIDVKTRFGQMYSVAPPAQYLWTTTNRT